MGSSLSAGKVATPATESKPVGQGSDQEGEIPQKAIALIKEFEGCELDAYDDGVRVWTIGYGATFYQDGRKVKSGDRISQAEADALLKFHLKSFWEALTKTTPYWTAMSDGKRGALLSFSFNTGWQCGSDGFSTLNRCIKEKGWDAVPSALALYVNPGTSTETGLRRRRKAEAELWVT